MSVDVEPVKKQPQRAVKWAILLGALALLVYLCAAILLPFADVIAWSAFIAIAFHPIHQRLLNATGRPSLSAFISSVVAVVTIIVPLLVVAGLVVNQVMALKDDVDAAFRGDFDTRALQPVLRAWEWLAATVGLDPARLAEGITQHASELGGVLAQYSLRFAGNVTVTLVSFVFVIFATFFLFRDGQRMAGQIPDYLPFERSRSERVVMRIREVVFASVYGVVVIGALQGLLVGLSFSVLGIPSAAVWGVVTVVTSAIPLLGAWVVWVPGVIYLAALGHWTQAVSLAVWGGVVISSVDNFLRPILVGERVKLNELAIFFSVLGGLQVFGLLGIIMGPVVFAVTASLLELLSDEDASRGA